jgi:hypothetical protein
MEVYVDYTEEKIAEVKKDFSLVCLRGSGSSSFSSFSCPPI